MTKDEKETHYSRDLPKSLQGIETILRFLANNEKDSFSIRQISENTDLSMRVAKNILLQLENLNQVKRVLEKNKVLPKWKITNFGRKVIKKAGSGSEDVARVPTNQDLIENIFIPKSVETLKSNFVDSIQIMETDLKNLQMELSKQLGIVLNLDKPEFVDLMGYIINQIKNLKQRLALYPKDPIAKYKLKKKDEKKPRISKSDEKDFFIELLFVISLVKNLVKRLLYLQENLAIYLENNNVDKAVMTVQDIRSLIRKITGLLLKRDDLKPTRRSFTKENMTKLENNELDTTLLNEISPNSLDFEAKKKVLEEDVIKLLAIIKNRQASLENQLYRITNDIPLIVFYNMILDRNPTFDINLDELETIIEKLADKGLIPGIRLIQDDEDHYMKVIQLIPRDIQKDEIAIIKHAIKFKKFSLADMIEKTGWDRKRVQNMLQELTENGILNHVNSHLYGEQWYVRSTAT